MLSARNRDEGSSHFFPKVANLTPAPPAVERAFLWRGGGRTHSIDEYRALLKLVCNGRLDARPNRTQLPITLDKILRAEPQPSSRAG